MKKLIKIYLSGKIKHQKTFLKMRDMIKKGLSDIELEIYLPPELAPIPSSESEKEKYYPLITKECLKYIDRADIVIANVSDYGKDTAAEIVYGKMMGKHVLALACNDEYKNDFFVRKFIDEVAVDDGQLVKIIRDAINRSSKSCPLNHGI